MAQRLGVLNQWFGGEWADRAAINNTVDELNAVEGTVQHLVTVVKQQERELLRLRALVMGLIEVMHQKAPFDEAELDREMKLAYAELVSPPPPMPPANPYATSGDPYRGTPATQAPPTVMVECSVCHQRVPQTRTNITGNGLVCDSCLR